VSEHATATPNVPNIVLSTAHPAKFPDAVAAACGTRPQLPAYLGGLMTRPERIARMPNDRGELERFIRTASRAAKEVV
jgi:threonine synthase